MKRIVNFVVACVLLLGSANGIAQNQSKKRVDGVIGIVGPHVVLDSDVDKGFIELKATGGDQANFTRCDVFGMLLENKLFVHQAAQDSIVIERELVEQQYEEQMNRLVENYGSVENTVKVYRKKNADELREDLMEQLEHNLMASRLQENITAKVEITPEEVRLFYANIPKGELPLIGKELEISEIIINPVITDEQKEAVIKQLKDIREDILEGNGTFASKVYAYSEDPGSMQNGGLYPVDKKSSFVKEFKETAFSLKEGEISQPFETEFGFHIMMLEKIRGNTLDVRHLLISPKPTDEAVAEAKVKMEDIRSKIMNNEMTFEEAARQYSDNKENKNSGGVMINPNTNETRFEINKITDRFLYNAIVNLKVGEVSQTTLLIDRSGSKSYQLIKATNMIDEHYADFDKDYLRIKDVALRSKKGEAISKWLNGAIDKAYIYISEDYKDCDFKNNWIK